MADIRQRIVFEKVRKPEDWKWNYNLEEGAAFGIGHGMCRLGTSGRRSPRAVSAGCISSGPAHVPGPEYRS
jgi:hypothetical protein